MFQIDCIRSQNQLQGLQEDWCILQNQINRLPVFFTWEWIITWWKFFGRGRELWILTARNEAGHLLGIAPFMQEKHPRGLGLFRSLQWIGIGIVYPAHLGLIVKPEYEQEVSQAFVNYMKQKQSQWDLVSLQMTQPDSLFLQQLKTGGGVFQQCETLISPYIPLPADWESYHQGLKKKLRRNLRYFHTRLEERCPQQVEFKRITQPTEIETGIKTLAELVAKRRHGRDMISAFDDPDFTAFHEAMAQIAMARGWLRLYELEVDHQTISALYCFHFQDIVYAYQIGIDPEWAEFSPGRLLSSFGIQSAIQDHAIEFDWLGGNHDYKYEWTDAEHRDITVHFARNLTGRLWLTANNVLSVGKAYAVRVLPQGVQNKIYARLFFHKQP